MKYFYREIGEGDWEECVHGWFLYCDKLPIYDTKTEQYQSEQGAKTVNTKQQDYFYQDAEEADFARLIMNDGKRKCYLYRKASGVYLEMLCPIRKTWGATLTTMKHLLDDDLTIGLPPRDAEEDDYKVVIDAVESKSKNPVNVPLFSSEFYHSENWDTAWLNHNNETAAAVKTLKMLNYSYKGGELWKPPIGKTPDFITEDKPVFTQEMQKNGELPPIGSFPIHIDEMEAVEILYSSPSFIIFKDKNGKEWNGGQNSFKPIDNRTDDQKIRDHILHILQKPPGVKTIIDDLLESDKFTITLNKE